jgi:N-acetylglutamate synthase-like GNAT family acetyltransferase
MPKLYLEEYRRVLTDKTIFIAVREGILRDFFSDIINDIKFLNRQGIQTLLFHNISNRFANQQHFKLLESKLPETTIIRVPAEQNFYSFVLNYSENTFKIIFVERKYLIDPQGVKINALNSCKPQGDIHPLGQLIANVNLKGVIDQIYRKISSGAVERVHIVPAGKQKIKHELFTIEGSGTLIADNFNEIFSRVTSDEEARVVAGILKLYRGEGYLKPRSIDYILRHRERFFVAKIDDIIVGCIEKKHIDPETVELAAFAISIKFRNRQIGVFLIENFLKQMEQQGVAYVISLSNNPKLAKLYDAFGFTPCIADRYRARQQQSPGVQMFIKTL